MEHLIYDPASEDFPKRFGEYLRALRSERKIALRHLADREVTRATLKAVERGEYPLDNMFVAHLTARYGGDLGDLLAEREPIVLLASGTIAAGGMEESFEPGDVDGLLDAYLRLIHRLRGEAETKSITLRREDLIDIADQLGRPRAEIVDRVAVLLGATGDERRAMVDLYLSGAMVLGLV